MPQRPDAQPSQQRAAYPLKEARELLGGISHQLAYKEINAGRLRTVRIGDRRLVTAAEINRYLVEAEA